ncbi:glycoside hydrolase family 5 protein [Hypholoma sublateritium FD-334 SS-4]|uniref:cellulase n=1 Tax=Hypholoma sublateritium (strain FD-334 SS-4) TaxID=945553 RepID=A0A0D2M0G1_HYPSF|nr:glycoside hydrolase family 5 protein [Hypholoma sublateritium FD-334 SS-4]
MSLIALSLLFGLGAVTGAHAQAPVYGQCGGIGWTGATTCASGSGCVVSNSYYSQCLPGAAVPTTTTAVPTPNPSTTVPSSTASAPGATPSSPAGTGKLSHVGINISGFDFGCNSDGSCTASAAWPPLLEYYGHDGLGQMTHFVNDDGFNTFRLPVGWQFLTRDAETGAINMTNFAEYNALVNACLGTGAFCIVDVHNYARFNGEIIGQGGPTNDVFAELWGNIATQFASNPKIIFGVMNEPHDVPDINMWAASVQAAVTAIRNAGATSQIILLPGNNWTSAETFVSNGSGPALLTVTNPDGSVTNLVFDVHKYLDSDNSGTNAECVTNNIESSWEPLAQWLRSNNRQAFNTETGGGNTASCVEFLCQQIAYQAQNSDVFLGYVGWAAGNFDPSSACISGYVLGETPTNTGSTWTDTLLVQSCVAPSSGSQSGSTGQ